MVAQLVHPCPHGCDCNAIDAEHLKRENLAHLSELTLTPKSKGKCRKIEIMKRLKFWLESLARMTAAGAHLDNLRCTRGSTIIFFQSSGKSWLSAFRGCMSKVGRQGRRTVANPLVRATALPFFEFAQPIYI